MPKLVIAYITCEEGEVDAIREALEGDDVRGKAEHVGITVEDVEA